MTVHVYHNPHFLNTRFGQGALDDLDLACLYLAAIVDTDDPAEAFRVTQHIDNVWHNSPGVITVVRSRSTSVGDVLATGDGRLLAVMPAGFPELALLLPAAESALAQNLDALVESIACLAARLDGVSVAETVVDEVAAQVRYLYTALLFALPLLEQAAEEGDADPYLARFAAEQAQWVLGQCSGGAPARDGRADEIPDREEEE